MSHLMGQQLGAVLSGDSPELHPCHAGTPDLSLYILDPRETYLRRSRASSPFPSHLRFNHASSPKPDPSSPALAGPSYSQAMQEVWTGKGLVNWALEEPGDGKILITGRLVRSCDFKQVVKVQEMSPLEAVMMADIEGDEESWGIEISLGFRSGSGAPVGVYTQVQQVAAMDTKREGIRPRSLNEGEFGSSGVAQEAQAHRQLQPGSTIRRPTPQPEGPIPVRAAQRPLSPTRLVSTTPHVKVRDINKKHSSGKRKKSNQPSTQSSRPKNASSSRSLEHRRPKSRSSSRHPCDNHDHQHEHSSDSFPGDVPGQIYADPKTLTKEQAERLIESPAFLSMLEKLTGQPIEAARNIRRVREEEAAELANIAKKPKLEPAFKIPHVPSSSKAAASDPQTVLKCWNCGRTKSAVWRMKVMEDGKSVRVCNGKSLHQGCDLCSCRQLAVYTGTSFTGCVRQNFGKALMTTSRISPCGTRERL